MLNLMRVIPLVLALVLSAVPPATAAEPACPDPRLLPPTPFTDLVSATHGTAIVCTGWYDLVNGTSARTFRPLQAVRRDQMAAFLARTMVAAGVPLPSRPPQPFTDVAASAHHEAIAQMAEVGLVQGTAEGLYEPAQPVRRGQMAAFLVRLAMRLGVDVPDAPDAFSDDDGTAHEHQINQAVALGLATGVTDATFAPGRAVRREQMASFLSRLVEVLVEQGTLKRRPVPAFTATTTAIPQQMRTQMTGRSWHSGCPVALDRLALLTVTHWDYEARARRGHLIVARAVAEDLTTVFRRLYNERFQIARIRPVHVYDGSDAKSMTDNNTSAFNCRRVTGGTSWSEHSYGTAIDINPRQNPYVNGSVVLPENGRPWVERRPPERGMIVPDSIVTRAFQAIGWKWGGDYRSLKDYQHFSASGR